MVTMIAPTKDLQVDTTQHLGLEHDDRTPLHYLTLNTAEPFQKAQGGATRSFQKARNDVGQHRFVQVSRHSFAGYKPSFLRS